MKMCWNAGSRDFTHAARSLSRAPGFTLSSSRRSHWRSGERGHLQRGQGRAPRAVAVPACGTARPHWRNGSRDGQPEEFGVPDELYFEYREQRSCVSRTPRSRHRIIDDTRGRACGPALHDPGDAVVLLDAWRRAAVRALPTMTSGRVVVLSHWLWRTWFGSDESDRQDYTLQAQRAPSSAS